MKIFYTVNAIESHIENRTWKERLFTLPWKPFKRHKVTHTPTILNFGEELLVHPSLKSKLEWQMKQQQLQTDPSTLASQMFEVNGNTIGLKGW